MLKTLSDDEFAIVIKSSRNISDVLNTLGYSTKGNSWGYGEVKRRMEALGLDYNSFIRNTNDVYRKPTKSNDTLFTAKSKHSRNIVRKTIIRDKLIDYKCSICGIDSWNGRKLSLELDHINGINYDHRLENLRFLCPNCHSQTTTYGSKNAVYIPRHQPDYVIPNILRRKIAVLTGELTSKKAIADKLNVKLSVVKQVFKEDDLQCKNHVNPNYFKPLKSFSDEIKDKIVSDYLNIRNKHKVAEINNMSLNNVNRILEERNIQTFKLQFNITARKISNDRKNCESYTFTSYNDAAKFMIDNGYSKGNVSTISKKILDVDKGRRKSAFGFNWTVEKISQINLDAENILIDSEHQCVDEGQA